MVDVDIGVLSNAENWILIPI